MKTATLFLIILLAGCDLRPQAQGISKHDLFEMRQGCAESVPRVLKYGIDYGENTTRMQTHYNEKLNMCFVMLHWVMNSPNLPPVAHWTLVDAQTYTYMDVKPEDKVWKALMEANDLDTVVATIK
jgi:hypothetical protein